MIRSTLTRRWQTTIPAEVRRALGLTPEQRLVYEIRGETVVLRPEVQSLADLRGSLCGNRPAGTKEEERDAARRRLADLAEPEERDRRRTG